MSSKEDRKFPRVPLQLLVQFKSANMEEFMARYAANISEGGMFICTETPRPIGAEIFFQFTVDHKSIIEGEGRVIHVTPPGSPNAGMGVEFTSVPNPSQNMIKNVVQRRLPDGTLVDDTPIGT